MSKHLNTLYLAPLLALALAGCDDAGPGAAEALEGAWQSACYEGSQTRLEYRGGELTGTFTAYGDEACSFALAVNAWTGRVSGGDAVGSDGARSLDLAFTGFTAEALNADAAAYNNMTMYCGFSDWAANVKKDVYGAACPGFAIPEGGESRDIFRIDGDALIFGVGSQIGVDLTEADRPTMLDASRTFTRIAD